MLLNHQKAGRGLAQARCLLSVLAWDQGVSEE